MIICLKNIEYLREIFLGLGVSFSQVPVTGQGKSEQYLLFDSMD